MLKIVIFQLVFISQRLFKLRIPVKLQNFFLKNSSSKKFFQKFWRHIQILTEVLNLKTALKEKTKIHTSPEKIYIGVF